MLMLYQAAFFDILPQYILYLLVAPPLLWLCLNGRAAAVVIASALVWLGVQFGLHLAPRRSRSIAMLATWQPGSDRPLRVQSPCLAVPVLHGDGDRHAYGANESSISPRSSIRAAPVSPGSPLASSFFFMAWRLSFTFLLVPDPVTHVFRYFESRSDFSVVFLVNFVALGYLVAWLLIAGPGAGSRFVRSAVGAPPASVLDSDSSACSAGIPCRSMPGTFSSSISSSTSTAASAH